MKVEQIMTRNVKVCRSDDTLNVAAQLMWDVDCGCVPVVSIDGNGKVVGIITDRDICMAAYTKGQHLVEIPVATAMAHEIISCKADDDVAKAEALMRATKVRRLPVLDKAGRLAGIVSLSDIAREAHREIESGRKELQAVEVGETLAAICEPRKRFSLDALAA